nr:DUF3710 domain-containing protein [Actinomycetota bacterium]
LSGPAAASPGAVGQLEEAFRQIVVVRGTDPMPVRDQLPLTLPADVAGELARQQADEAADGRTLDS